MRPLGMSLALVCPAKIGAQRSVSHAAVNPNTIQNTGGVQDLSGHHAPETYTILVQYKVGMHQIHRTNAMILPCPKLPSR